MPLIQARLNDISHGGKICTSMSINYSFGPRRRAGGEGNGEHIIFVGCLGLQAGPGMTA